MTRSIHQKTTPQAIPCKTAAHFAIIPFVVVFIIVVVSLFSFFNPYSSISFVSYRSTSKQIPLPLILETKSSTYSRSKILLKFEGSFKFLDTHSLDLAFFTSQTHPRVLEARLFQGDGCILEAVPPAFSGSQMLRFRHPDLSTLHFKWLSKKSCDLQSPFSLEVNHSNEAKLGLWAHYGQVESGSLFLKVVDPNPNLPIEASASVLMGRAIIHGDTTRIIEIPKNSLTSMSGRTIAFLSLAFFFTLLMAHGISPISVKDSKILSLLCSFGLIGSILFYILFLPPFQAADEPDHFISFASEEQNNRALNLANANDFERVKFRYLESLSPPTENAIIEDWPGHVTSIDNYASRSPTASAVYTFTSKYVGSNLADLRAVGIIFLLISVWIIFGFCWYLGIPRATIFSIFILSALFQPVIYFSSTVSNYGLLSLVTMVYAVAFGCALLKPDKPVRSPWAILFLFVLLLLILSISLNGLPTFASFTGAVVLISLARASLEEKLTSRCRYWALFLVGALCIVGAIPMVGQGFQFISHKSPVFSASVNKYLSRANGFTWYLVLLAFFSLAVELSIAFLIKVMPIKRFLAFFVLGASALFFLIAGVYFSLKSGSMPFLTQGLDPESVSKSIGLSRVEYGMHAALNYIWSLLGNYPDYWTSQSFWSPYGWLDTNGPENISRLLNLTTFLGIIALARSKMARMLPFSGILPCLILFISILGVGSVSYHAAGIGIDIVGRYLTSIQVFTCFLAIVCGTDLALKQIWMAELLLIIIFLSWPIAGMLTILDRYYLAFGGSI